VKFTQAEQNKQAKYVYRTKLESSCIVEGSGRCSEDSDTKKHLHSDA